MATVARLLPRHWDGRRLLQFLTGLALIALAFMVPALQESADQPADSPVTIVTTVDSPLPAGLPVVDVPAGSGPSTNKTNLAMTQEGHTAGSATPTTPGADPAAGSQPAGSDPGSPPAGAKPASGTPAATDADAASGSPAAAGTDPGSPAGPRSEAEAMARHAAALQGAQAGGYGPGSASPSVVPGETGLPAQAWHGGRRICFESHASGSGPQGAHGERGPPRI